MNNFILKLLLFIAVFCGFSFGFDCLIQEGLKRTDYREISKWNEVIKGGIDADILVVGSSRAIVQFNTEWLEDKLGIRCYNLGINGSAFEVQKLILELYLSQNEIPEKLFWVVDFHSFNKTKEVFRYDQFSPYAGNIYIDSILDLNLNINPLIKYVPVVRFNSNETLKYRGFLNLLNAKNEYGRIKNGFTMPYISWDGKFDDFINENPEGIDMPFDELIFKEFLSLSLRLKEKGIEIIWVLPPYYRPGLELINNWRKLEAEFRSKSYECRIKYSSYLDLKISEQKVFFYNASHLNKDGVDAFMEIFLDNEFSHKNVFIN